MAFNNVYQGKKVLITGNTGFKGSWLSTWLTMLGAEVYGYSIDVPSEPGMFNVCKLNDKIHHNIWKQNSGPYGENQHLRYRPPHIFPPQLCQFQSIW